MSLTLVQLISEQTMQNLLPVLALRPARVIHIRSRLPKFKLASSNIANATRSLSHTLFSQDLKPQFDERDEFVIQADSPLPDATEAKLLSVLQAAPPPVVVNITGGTKLMSIGALSAAKAANVPAFYCDTQARRFVWLHGQPPATRYDFESLAMRMTVESVLASHGLDPGKLRSATPSEAELAFGRGAQQLRSQHSAEMEHYASQLRKHLSPDGKPVKGSTIDTILAAGLPPVTNDVEHEFLGLAEAAGVVRQQAGKWFYHLKGNTLRPDDRVRAAKEANKKLLGGWFEWFVFDRMKASGRFIDLRTEVQSRDRSQQALGETDIMGIDLHQLGLVFVSCKVSDGFLDKPLEHVFATRHRSLEFGGTFAQTIFCVREFRDANKQRIFADACRVVRARLIVGEPDFNS